MHSRQTTYVHDSFSLVRLSEIKAEIIFRAEYVGSPSFICNPLLNVWHHRIHLMIDNLLDQSGDIQSDHVLAKYQ